MGLLAQLGCKGHVGHLSPHFLCFIEGVSLLGSAPKPRQPDAEVRWTWISTGELHLEGT